jgi:hypothetical protein
MKNLKDRQQPSAATLRAAGVGDFCLTLARCGMAKAWLRRCAAALVVLCFASTTPLQAQKFRTAWAANGIEVHAWLGGNGALRTLTDTNAAGLRCFYRMRQW